MSQLEWSATTEADVPALVRLGTACLERDGGLPDLTDPEHLRTSLVTDTAISGRDELGDVVAAAAVGVDASGGRTATGLIDPSVMGRGIGQEIAEWVTTRAGGPVRFVLDSVSPEAEELFAQLELHRVFAESVMRHSLKHIPVVRRPEGVVTLPFTDDTSEAFHHAYAASFADQPGYDAGSARAWGRWLREQHGFHPEDSRVAMDLSGTWRASSPSPRGGSRRSVSSRSGVGGVSAPTSWPARSPPWPDAMRRPGSRSAATTPPGPSTSASASATGAPARCTRSGCRLRGWGTRPARTPLPGASMTLPDQPTSLPEEVVDAVRGARRILVLTGAGMSAESGVATFRDAQTGLWEEFDPTQLATEEAWREDPPFVWAWYAWRMQLVRQVDPNAGHRALAELAGLREVMIVTQNIDDLHERAGSAVTAHVHGSLDELRCADCGTAYTAEVSLPVA